MAQRKKINFSGYKGIVFSTKTNKEKRFWFELRTGKGLNELSYRHSFLPEKRWRKISIPFSKLNIVSKSSKKIDLAKINALFFTINNVLSYSEKGGVLELKDIGLY